MRRQTARQIKKRQLDIIGMWMIAGEVIIFTAWVYFSIKFS